MFSGIKILLAIATLLGFAGSLKGFAYEVAFENPSYKVIGMEADKTTGLNSIYIAYTLSGISAMEISGCSSTNPKIMKYSNLGGGYAIDIPFTFSDGLIRVDNPEGNTGYILTDGDASFYFWLVDYRSFGEFSMAALSEEESSDCSQTVLEAVATGEPIYYYTIDGRRKTLSREIEITYDNLEWDEEKSLFILDEKKHTYEYISDKIAIVPPLYASSSFKITGDRFLNEWNREITYESKVFAPTGVMVSTTATQTNTGDSDEASNIIKTDTGGLGGSAPAEISFQGFVSDAVLHTEWQIASDPEFEYIQLRYNEQDVDYVFNEEGTYYVRFIGSNADGSCEAVGETYTVNIGASDLRIPNAFSPNDDGVNDVWKVGYRSLLDFKCWIFDSNGTQLFYFDRPEEGWDGKYNGKTVTPGVYYYVITARGADGKKYKRSGDINIVGYRKRGNSASSSTE